MNGMMKYIIKTAAQQQSTMKYEFLLDAIMWVLGEMEENPWTDFCEIMGNNPLIGESKDYLWVITDIETDEIVWTEPRE